MLIENEVIKHHKGQFLKRIVSPVGVETKTQCQNRIIGASGNRNITMKRESFSCSVNFVRKFSFPFVVEKRLSAFC